MRVIRHNIEMRGLLRRSSRVLLVPLAGFMVFMSQPLLAYAASESADSPVAAATISEEGSDWADALTTPRDYLRTARRAVDHRRYAVAARNLRNAAAMVAHNEEYAVGRERKRLHIAAQALRLTAKDVAAGAVTSSAQLDGVLNDTHRDLRARSGLDR